jgi:sulfite reductase (NADPH) hemoprotein beta-component
MSDKDTRPLPEIVKCESDYLRGTLRDSLADSATGALAEHDTMLSKFHGIYQQDDRELRDERRQQKLEPRYQFMLRLRLPGGVLSPKQWLGLDDICQRYADESLRLTTRQTFQFHQVYKHELAPLITQLDKLGLDSRGACGDVNRNVISNVNPYLSSAQQHINTLAHNISERLKWRSHAYAQTWLDEPASQTPEGEQEPFYGYRYLPRKFKIAIALPPHNDCDVLANDIGLIAIEQDGHIVGFNVAVGGGMGMTYGERATYPRLATPVGFVPVEQIEDACEAIAAIQRDHGDRSNRAHARFKYTLDDKGLEWFCDEFAKVHGTALEPLRPYTLTDSGDRFGWVEDDRGQHHLTLLIPSGRIRDWEHLKMRTALREIAKVHSGEFRITCNQNMIIANVSSAERQAITTLVEKYGLDDGTRQTQLARNAISCVAFPTCGLAMAESERYLPELIKKIEALMDSCGVGDENIQLRVTGCPNGCARPYLGEIALTGKAPGKYNLLLGADRGGQKLNRLYQENIDEAQILAALEPLLRRYAQERGDGEGFGEFLYRAGILDDTTGSESFHTALIARG